MSRNGRLAVLDLAGLGTVLTAFLVLPVPTEPPSLLWLTTLVECEAALSTGIGARLAEQTLLAGIGGLAVDR